MKYTKDEVIQYAREEDVKFIRLAFCDVFGKQKNISIMPLPWRPEHGRVVQMFSAVTHPNGMPAPGDTRSLLKRAVDTAKKAGYSFTFSAEQEFYLFLLGENSKPTMIPCDDAG